MKWTSRELNPDARLIGPCGQPGSPDRKVVTVVRLTPNGYRHFGSDEGFDRLCGFTGTVFGPGFGVVRTGLHVVFVMAITSIHGCGHPESGSEVENDCHHQKQKDRCPAQARGRLLGSGFVLISGRHADDEKEPCICGWLVLG